MDEIQKNNPLHAIKLQQIIVQLVDYFDWDTLAILVPINCFKNEPSVKSSLKFLRRTPWARRKVEDLYLQHLESIKKSHKSKQ